MTIPPNTFKRRLAAREKQLGFWLSSDSLAATEIASGAGFDWLLLDMEHTVIPENHVERHLLAARHGGSAEFVVRIPWNEPVVVKRLMDAGVRSFMFPQVQTADEARLAVGATRYPPHGVRGFSGIHRGNSFAREPDYPFRAHEEVCIIVQAESPEAIAAIPGFAGIAGLDAVLIGPNDLAASMGMLGQFDHEIVRAKIAEAREVILAAGLAAGILNFDPARAGALLRDGFGFAAVGSDLVTLVRGTDALLSAVRAASSEGG